MSLKVWPRAGSGASDCGDDSEIAVLGRRLDSVEERADDLQFLGLLFTHVWSCLKLASRFAVEPCRKTGWRRAGLQSRPLASHRLQIGFLLSPIKVRMFSTANCARRGSLMAVSRW